MKKLTILFFILCFTASVFAGDCDLVDLNTPDGILYEKYDKVKTMNITPHSISLKSATREQSLMLKHISSEFNVYGSQSLPIGIEFCSTCLSKGPNYTLKAISTLEERLKDCSAQSVIVTGRRKNPATEQCEFRIRNSSGNCKNVISSYLCNKKNGDTWVPLDILERYLMSVSILK